MRPFALFSALLVVFSALAAPAQQFLDTQLMTFTTNAATRSVALTNWPGQTLPWYPASLLLCNRDLTTGAILRIEHHRLSVTNAVATTNNPPTVTVTNLLFSTDVAFDVPTTNFVFPTRWYVNPYNEQLVITTVITNGELLLNREIAR